MKHWFGVENQETRIPKRVQDVIPIRTVYEDGLFMVRKGCFSKTFRFQDVNYTAAGEEDQKSIFAGYCRLLNGLDQGAETKITIYNRVRNQKEMNETILLKKKEDGRDAYREEYNRMIREQAIHKDTIVQEKMLTITVPKKSREEARQYFARTGAELSQHFLDMGSRAWELDGVERLRIFHDFFRPQDVEQYQLNLKECMRRGQDFRDYICPDVVERGREELRLGNYYARVLFLKDYATRLSDKLVLELTEAAQEMMLSIDIVPVATEEAIREVEKRTMSVETNITNWQRRQNANHNFSAVIPYDMALQRQEAKSFLEELTTNNQKMFLSLLTMVITAPDQETLEQQTEAVQNIAHKYLCQIITAKFQQLDGLNTVLPYGGRHIDALRTLTTRGIAIQIPFRVQEVQERGGLYYGQNMISRNPIIANRRGSLSGHGFYLGITGSGKSFAAKEEIGQIMLSTAADILIIDPEREYTPMVRALGGEVIEISATSPHHINALDLHQDYGDESDPVKLKSSFILSLCEQSLGKELGPKEKSLVDRCAGIIYKPFRKARYHGEVPTLVEFRKALLEQPEQEAKDLALGLELFTEGSLNTFAQHSNVDIQNRLICYDILDLGDPLKAIGMSVILDNIRNRITANRIQGKETYVYIDEIYLLFQYELSANFLYTLWKRARKYGAVLTGITQNVEDLLQSHTARTMLANSEFLMLLNQGRTDCQALASLLQISEHQMSYVTDVGSGKGLLKIRGSLLPFENRFPRDTKLYELITTKAGE